MNHQQKKNIYFCGSMRGVEPSSQLYQQIVRQLENYGDVLTKHVAYPELWQNNEKGWTDKQIFDSDLAHFKKSNIMVAEVTAPSHGVGIELGWAMGRENYPVLCLYNLRMNQYKCSALVNGCQQFKIINYATDQEALNAVDQFMNNYLE